MIQLMNRFRRITKQTSLVSDERGLSTVEYVIILVLIAAAAVGTWTTFGATITTKIKDSEKEIRENVVITPTDNAPTKSDH
jgi:Flp pilus assembly pilin Flp